MTNADAILNITTLSTAHHMLYFLVLTVLLSLCSVGVICAAPAVEGAWWRAQVITFYKETSEVEIRYVDYGGYDRVKIDSLRQIR